MYWLIVLMTICVLVIVHTFCFRLAIVQSRYVSGLGNKQVSFDIPSWRSCLGSLFVVLFAYGLLQAVLDGPLSSVGATTFGGFVTELMSTGLLAGIVWYVLHSMNHIPAKISALAALTYLAFTTLFTVSAVWVLKLFA